LPLRAVAPSRHLLPRARREIAASREQLIHARTTVRQSLERDTAQENMRAAEAKRRAQQAERAADVQRDRADLANSYQDRFGRSLS
jgi:hypothetical protein